MGFRVCELSISDDIEWQIGRADGACTLRSVRISDFYEENETNDMDGLATQPNESPNPKKMTGQQILNEPYIAISADERKFNVMRKGCQLCLPKKQIPTVSAAIPVGALLQGCVIQASKDGWQTSLKQPVNVPRLQLDKLAGQEHFLSARSQPNTSKNIRTESLPSLHTAPGNRRMHAQWGLEQKNGESTTHDKLASMSSRWNKLPIHEMLDIKARTRHKGFSNSNAPVAEYSIKRCSALKEAAQRGRQCGQSHGTLVVGKFATAANSNNGSRLKLPLVVHQHDTKH